MIRPGSDKWSFDASGLVLRHDKHHNPGAVQRPEVNGLHIRGFAPIRPAHHELRQNQGDPCRGPSGDVAKDGS